MKESILYQNTTNYITCIDHTVSKEEYTLEYQEKYDMLVTTPVPSNLENYYLSEDYISHTDSKKSLLDKIYQWVKNYSLNKKLQLVNSFNTQEKTILDIGAGTGDFLKVCNKNNWETYGIEPSKKARTIAAKKNITLYDSLEKVATKKFDVITLWHVLEHIPNLLEEIASIKKLLKPNGVLIIAVPNYKSYDAAYYKNFWAAFDVPRHLWHFSKNSIQNIFSEFNFKVTKILPMKFDAYYVSLLSEKYKKGKMNPIKAFIIGYISNYKAKKNLEYSSLIYILKNKQNSF